MKWNRVLDSLPVDSGWYFVTIYGDSDYPDICLGYFDLSKKIFYTEPMGFGIDCVTSWHDSPVPDKLETK